MVSLFDLSNEIALVIGATGALGGAIAEGLASAGAKIIVAGRNIDRGLNKVNEIKNKGGSAEFVQIDALSRDSLKSARIEIEKKVGTPTILVNAAGGTDPKATVTPENPIENLDIQSWKNNFDLNLLGGVLLPCQEFGPGMVKIRHGSIINIASVSGHIPLSRVVAYSAAKAAVLNLTKFLAREWARFNVRVNSITPGFFPAEQNKHLLFNPDGSPTARAQAILNHTPMYRFGEPHELIGAAIFLASPKASSFVTGIDIKVDGGFLCQTI
jgi:NAD(P)-dependent dehydrogenase (short-subunit alcohol dehydrogenase family)